MKLEKLALLSLMLIGLLSACASVPPADVATVEPDVIALQITPAVEHWLPRVAACAQDIPDFGVFIQILPRDELSLANSDLILRLGERLESDPFVAVMGIEEIVIAAGEDVPVNSLSLASLQNMYIAEITRWNDITGAEVGQEGGTVPINLLSYPAGHEIEILFRRAYLNDAPITAAPQVFVTIEFLQGYLESYPTGLGYLLESQVPEGMRVLEITDELLIPASQYVLAITAREPEGRLKALLTCLQNTQ